MLIAVNFHYVRPTFDHPYPGIHGVTTDEFRAQLELLGRFGTFVSMSDVESAIEGSSELPDRSWLVTFDDGLREQYEHALPVLDELDVPAIFFPNTGPIADRTVSDVHKLHLLRASTEPTELRAVLMRTAGRFGIVWNEDASDPSVAQQQYHYDDAQTARFKYFLNFLLDPSEKQRLVDAAFTDLSEASESEISTQLYMERPHLVDLADRDALGTHAHQHVPLGTLSSEAAEDQVRRSLDLLEDWTGRRVRGLSYPYGSRGAVVPAVDPATRAGARWAITMERAGNPDLSEPMLIARCANNDVPGGTSCRWKPDSIFETIPERSWHGQDR